MSEHATFEPAAFEPSAPRSEAPLLVTNLLNDLDREVVMADITRWIGARVAA